MNNKLSQLREARGWSQGDLADRLKVSRQTINALERGRYDPSLLLAFRIAVLFQLSIEEIFQPDAADVADLRRARSADDRRDDTRRSQK